MHLRVADFGLHSDSFRADHEYIKRIRLLEESRAMEVFVVSEPLYDVCESWAEEPEVDAWEAIYPQALAWLIRLN